MPITKLYICQVPQLDWKFALHSVSEIIHLILGILILIAGITMLRSSIILKNQPWIRVAAISASGALLSVLGGVLFITTQNDMFSYLMAIGLMAYLLAVNWGLYAQERSLKI